MSSMRQPSPLLGNDTDPGPSADSAPFPDMVWIPGGTFRMGSDKHYPEERPRAPRHRRRVLDRSRIRSPTSASRASSRRPGT